MNNTTTTTDEHSEDEPHDKEALEAMLEVMGENRDKDNLPKDLPGLPEEEHPVERKHEKIPQDEIFEHIQIVDGETNTGKEID